MKKQQGFTLIELMIVVAIIGILAAVAIPQYQNYVGKSNVASAVSTLSGNKTGIEAYIMENGLFPNNTKAKAATGTAGQPGYVAAVPGSEPDDLGVVQPTFGDITFVTSDTAAKSTGAGSIDLKFSTGNPGVKDKKVRLARTADGTWTCLTDVDADFVGKSCEHSTSAL